MAACGSWTETLLIVPCILGDTSGCCLSDSSVNLICSAALLCDFNGGSIFLRLSTYTFHGNALPTFFISSLHRGQTLSTLRTLFKLVPSGIRMASKHMLQ